MKNLRTTLTSFGLALVLAMFISSCSDEMPAAGPPEIGDDVKAQFKELGFDVSDIRMVPNNNPFTGKQGEYNYLLEGDIEISQDQMEEMSKSDVFHQGAMEEQYRTTNLVGGLPRTISVIGYTGGSYALTSKMRTALQWAINNYNRLNTGLNFTLTYGTNYPAYDIVVYKTSGSAGGSAGFPSGGDPYQFVQIFSGTDSYDTNVVEHVITHEIGHCMGMRHTDWFNRSLSCGSGGSEGQAGVGAHHIPGTPTGFDSNSVMLSCFSSGEDGEFGYYDEEALEYLY